ncbi:hypothetical protein M071_4176 [Bacteroides fragilis str. Ds-233]|nr:hypothetical protein M071_4176 [Bacteroides fragilis str. Ds-233]
MHKIMDYKNMLIGAKNAGVATEKAMWRSIDGLNEMLCKIKEEHPEMFWEFMREQHGIMYGNHYDEAFAKYDVSQMHHTRPDGSKHKGEHWGIDSVREALKGISIPSTYNAWDCYVALNANWHDKEVVFKKWFPENHEQKVIEDAVDFYFNDEDAPNGKIWLYMSAMDYDD